MLRLIVPALFQSDDLIDMLGAARLPGLDRLLARGRREPLGSDDTESLLCQALGIARQQDWPVAPISMALAGQDPEQGYWLRADPVHVRIERDRLLLHEIPDSDAEGEKILCAALSEHFAGDFSLQFLRPGAWVLRAGSRPQLTTTPLSRAAGQNIDPLLPAGADALHWRKLLNEVQMLLFQHPANQAREARGEDAINSVWLWGGGYLPEAMLQSARTVLSSEADWRALGAFAGAGVGMLPEKWDREVPENALLVLDEPHRRLRSGDPSGWLEAMRQLEKNWLNPLLAAGATFRVEDPLQGQGVYWRPAYRWKFWQRGGKASTKPLELRMSAPAESGIDAFGNRYQ